MNVQQLYSFPKDRVRALFGLEPAALSLLLPTVLPEFAARRLAAQSAKSERKRGPGGCRKLYPYQEVLLTLVYLRYNISHAVVGQMFCVSADISENAFHDVVLVLRDLCPAHRFDAQKKWTKKEPSWSPDTLDVLFVDSFETPIARPSLPGVQKKFYSGKKKCHTVKTQIVTDKRGEVIALEPGYPGPLPDKTLYQESRAAGQYPQAARRADLGVPKMLLPHRKKRGRKRRESQRVDRRAEGGEPARGAGAGVCGTRHPPGESVAHPAGRVPIRRGPVFIGRFGYGRVSAFGQTLPRLNAKLNAKEAGGIAAKPIDQENPLLLHGLSCVYDSVDERHPLMHKSVTQF